MSVEADRALVRGRFKPGGPGQALLGGFSSLTDAQRAAIPYILDGRSALLVAPTASGKTEAVLAPLLENLFAHGEPLNEGSTSNVRLLYVAPTRALVNDVYDRLRGSTVARHVRVGRRTGEHRDPGEILVTTPESFDSMLARGWSAGHDGVTHELQNVRAVVLDELHLFAEGPRGVQLIGLLARLDGRLRQPVQRVALSATIADARALADRFLGEASEVLLVGGGRRLVVEGWPSDWPSHASGVDPLAAHVARAEKGHTARELARVLARHQALLRDGDQGRSMKALAFSPRRARVDELSAALKQAIPDVTVLAHHGSLDQGVRERTEQDFRRSKGPVVLVATSTLEVGVDIGDVSIVLLDGPPPSVGAMLQRLGRGNRRTSSVLAVPFATNDVDAVVLASMLRAAADARLDDHSFVCHYSVVVQQCASLLFQSDQHRRVARTRQGLKRETLASRLDAMFPGEGATLVDALVRGAALQDDRGVLTPGAEMQRLMDSPRELHGNIEGGASRPMVDAMTGQPIAWVSGSVVGTVSVGGVTYLANDNGDSIELRRQSGGPAGAAVRYGARSAPGLRETLLHLRRGLGWSDDSLVRFEGRYWHFGGALAAGLLAAADCAGEAWASPTDPRVVADADFDWLARNNWKPLEKLCGFGPNQRRLPESLRQEAVAKTARRLKLNDFLRRRRLVTEVSAEQAAILRQVGW